jgi:hypothetical protein
MNLKANTIAFCIHWCNMDRFKSRKKLLFKYRFNIPLVMMFRYMILLQIHLNKRRLFRKFNLKDNEDYSVGKCQKLFIIMLNIFGSHWITIIFPLLWMWIYLFLILMVNVYFNFICSVDSFFYLRLIHGIGIFIATVSIIALLIFDFIINIPLTIRCQFKRIFVKNDPYRYRLDMLAVITMIPLILVWYFVALPQFFIAPLVDLLIFNGFLVSGFLAFNMTIFKKIYYFIKKKTKKNYKMLTVSDVTTEKMIGVFTEYCEQEWSSENILLKKDIIAYKESIERKPICLKIMRQYLVKNSPMEVNCPQRIISEVLTKIDFENYEDNLFKDLEKVVDLNLGDTISRFTYSSLLRDFLEEKKSSKKSLGL